LVTTFLAVTVTVTTWSPGMSVTWPVNEVVADAVTVIVVLAPGLSVPEAELTVMWALTDAVHVALAT
jgi:hypothetical protein